VRECITEENLRDERRSVSVYLSIQMEISDGSGTSSKDDGCDRKGKGNICVLTAEMLNYGLIGTHESRPYMSAIHHFLNRHNYWSA
jgi:hypothetical protein